MRKSSRVEESFDEESLQKDRKHPFTDYEDELFRGGTILSLLDTPDIRL